MSEKEMEIESVEARITFNQKDMTVAYLLWFFLGTLGIHRFYLGRPKSALFFLFSSLFGWILLYIPYAIMFIWWLCDSYLVYKLVNEHNEKEKAFYLKCVKKEKKKQEPVIEPAQEFHGNINIEISSSKES